jgi:IS605 OrfB family transposase
MTKPKEMKLVFKYFPKLNDLQLNIIEGLSFHTTKLYNIANYDCRKNKFKSYVDMEKEYKANWHKDFLHSHTYQHCLKTLEQNWKSYFASIKDYKKNPSKYKGMPMPPRFKNTDTKKNEIVFTNLSIRVRENTVMLSLAKAVQQSFEVKSLNFEVPKKLQSLADLSTIQQVRIQWDNSKKIWTVLIIYGKIAKEQNPKNTNVMAVDIGLDNLAVITFKDNPEAYIIDGRTLKSVNSFANKRIAKLTSIRMKQTGSKKFKRTKRIANIQKYRNNYIQNYFHKASVHIIQLAEEYHVGTIVFGDIKDIKQKSHLKTFVQIPVQKLYELTKYKAELNGMSTEKRKERGVSAVDLEPISTQYYNKNRRIERGLFKSNTGMLVNADVNGSLNILRRYLKDECIPKLIELARDKGYVTTPVRIRVA